jgi:organic radical activating enzyme
MQFDRKKIYKLPWSKSDNPGAWVEVTDICNLNCPGCFRHTLEGHRKLEEVKREILEVANLTNCSRIAISGGEPLIYPHIVETVSFISSNGFKPIILTNGVNLTRDLALELEKAGLYQFYFHVDSGQNRPDWMDKSESELNELRQHFADLTHKLKHVRCGFNITISRKNIEFIPEIVNWYRMNISKVQHLSLIAQRGIPLLEGYDYYVNGKILNLKQLPNAKSNINEINISTEEMYSILYEHCDAIFPAAYLSGTAKTETYKFLIIMNIGTKNKIYGEVGPKTIELYQYIHHLFKKSYSAVIPKVNKTIFILSFVDKILRKSFVKFIVEGIKNPLNIFQRIHVQQLVLQQPFEIIEGETNLCDGCVNLMLYRGNLINSCRLDEYRLLGGPLTMNKQNNR